MKRTMVIGHLDFENGATIGAVVKARSIYYELMQKYGGESVGAVDIYKWRRKKLRVFFYLIMAFFSAKNIVLVISDTSGPLMQFFRFLKGINRNKVFYFVVGGDIDDILAKKRNRLKTLKFVDFFFVETKRCIQGMNQLGLNNTILFRNFKRLEQPSTTKCVFGEEVKICIFSRINEGKGISDAISAVEKVNSTGKNRIYLDIFGRVDESYKDCFNDLLCKSDSCRYLGVINPEESVATIADYDFLLFPTRFDGEGIPGTVIDAFASGVPVIASRWKNHDEMLFDGFNGLLYDYKDYEGLVDKLANLECYKKDYKTLCENSKKSYEEYMPEKIMPLLYEMLE